MRRRWSEAAANCRRKINENEIKLQRLMAVGRSDRRRWRAGCGWSPSPSPAGRPGSRRPPYSAEVSPGKRRPPSATQPSVLRLTAVQYVMQTKLRRRRVDAADRRTVMCWSRLGHRLSRREDGDTRWYCRPVSRMRRLGVSEKGTERERKILENSTS